MRQRASRFLGAVLMTVLMLAQTTGLCRAYLCNCEGEARVTLESHCHDHCEFGPEHIAHEAPCCLPCSEHQHDLATLHFLTTQPRGGGAEDLCGYQSTLIALLPPPVFAEPNQTCAAHDRRVMQDIGPPMSCRLRHTSALLI